jgi:hypothetical protein
MPFARPKARCPLPVRRASRRRAEASRQRRRTAPFHSVSRTPWARPAIGARPSRSRTRPCPRSRPLRISARRGSRHRACRRPTRPHRACRRRTRPHRACRRRTRPHRACRTRIRRRPARLSAPYPGCHPCARPPLRCRVRRCPRCRRCRRCSRPDLCRVIRRLSRADRVIRRLSLADRAIRRLSRADRAIRRRHPPPLPIRRSLRSRLRDTVHGRGA